MKHARFTVINPDHRMIVMFAHDINPFPPICEHEIRKRARNCTAREVAINSVHFQ